jgi:hypothetical protein
MLIKRACDFVENTGDKTEGIQLCDRGCAGC